MTLKSSTTSRLVLFRRKTRASLVLRLNSVEVGFRVRVQSRKFRKCLITLLSWQLKHNVCAYRIHSQVFESDSDQCLQTTIVHCMHSAKNVALRMI